ncbi:Rha family transcriptional regulator [uncultured Desulfovibrio sp.]|uniref:Rha family transcriptional regulator n=1 Tax=uncultured Desulfovibrio sp. TaxID=167968 RepID=UPI0026035C1E|nr:Rha family transcriptional regulator [uncultured Desulfovibrio sp.]
MSRSFFSPVSRDGISVQSLGAAPAVLSTEVARHFQKRHSHVLRDIERICSVLPADFTGSNFGLSEYTDVTGRKLPAYLLTRDAFSLLVMGFTGTAAIRWKLRYIEAFNALEADVLAHQNELARQAGYQQGRDETLSLPALRAERQAGYLEGMREGRQHDTITAGTRQSWRTKKPRPSGAFCARHRQNPLRPAQKTCNPRKNSPWFCYATIQQQ